MSRWSDADRYMVTFPSSSEAPLAEPTGHAEGAAPVAAGQPGSGKQWADYVITGVRYAPGRSHIFELEVREDRGETLGPAAMWPRIHVLQAIDQGCTFVTGHLRGGSWSSGVSVRLVPMRGERYLRADGKHVDADNLDGIRPVRRML